MTEPELDLLDAVTHQLHALGRQATDDHAPQAGTAYRYAANLVRRAFRLDLLDYDGREEIQA